MQVQNTTSMMDTSATDNTSSSTANTTTDPTGTTDLANEDTFLQLMVAQIKNQDPLQPMDSSQFLTQLAQFSQLEQLMGIHTDIGNLTQTLTADQSTDSTSTTDSAAQ